jgi:hypothetical protein
VRVYVYVDGFNLYYRALRGTPHKWLNPLALAESVLDPTDQIDCIRYFTARVSSRSGDPDAPRRQEIYLKALRTLPGIKFHFGRFLPKTKVRPLVANPNEYVEVHDTEEKGSDVNLASYLIHDGWRDLYDAALVISQDSDLCEAMRIVRNDLEKAVGVLWLESGEPGRRFRNVTSFVRHATPARLAATQFASPLMGKDGRLIEKPADW